MISFVSVLVASFYAPLVTGYELVAAGAYHTIVVENGQAFAVGSNDFGQLGDGSTIQRRSWVSVMQGVKNVAAGKRHSVFVKQDGTAWITGSSSGGQLGDARNGGKQTHPIQVMRNVRAAAVGDHHSVFLTLDGAAYTMGDNRHGQLGDGTLHSRSSVVQVVANGVRHVSAGSAHSLFVLDDGIVMGSGANFNGQLGNNTKFYCGRDCTFPESHFQVVRPVKLKDRIQHAVAGGNSTMMIDTSGIVWVSGQNDLGQLCREEWGSINTFMAISRQQKDAVLGMHHSASVAKDGTALVCGLNSHGQLGYMQQLRNSVAWQGTPIAILAGIQSAAVGNEHTVFLDIRGRVWGAGSNSYGQIGNLTMPRSLVDMAGTTIRAVQVTTVAPRIVELNSSTAFGVVLLFVSIAVVSMIFGHKAAHYFAARIDTAGMDDFDGNALDVWNQISGTE